jgi:hypothetical protein
MSLSKLLRHFENYTQLPIEISDVRAWVEERCPADRVAVYFTNMNPAILRGFVRRDRRRMGAYSGLLDIAEIHVSVHMDMAWRRLVACKEMIHLHDSVSVQVKTPEAFERLFADILANPYSPDGSPRIYSAPAVADILALWAALAVLCPLPMIIAFRRAVGEDRMTLEEVAEAFGIPPETVGWVLSLDFDNWVRHQMRFSLDGK